MIFNTLLLFLGARGSDDAEQEVLCRDRPWCVGQEPQDFDRARPTAVHPRHQSQCQAEERRERVNYGSHFVARNISHPLYALSGK